MAWDRLLGKLLDYQIKEFVTAPSPSQDDVLQNYVLEKEEQKCAEENSSPERITIFTKEQTKNI